MRITLLIVSIVLISFACQNKTKETTQTEETPKEQAALTNLVKMEITIEGMTCTGCENTIQNTISKFEGIYSVKASHEQGLAVLEADSTLINISEIEEAINQVGYKAVEHKKLTE